MKVGVRLLAGIFAIVLGAWARPFPVEYLADLGAMREGEVRRFGEVSARVLREWRRVRLEGAQWSVSLPIMGGAWSTKLYRGDFDGNGRKDLWLQVPAPSMQGACHQAARLYWIRFDESGLPVLETALSYAPHWIRDVDGDGRAEFRVKDCLGKVVTQWEEDPAKVAPKLSGNWEALRELREGQEMPRMVVRDGLGRRDIWEEKTLPVLKAAMRDGLATAWKESEWLKTAALWIDAERGMLPPGEVRAEIVITAKKRTAFAGSAYADSWRVEVMADGRTVRQGYTAMQHTNTNETRFEAPPGATQLLYARTGIAQWRTAEGTLLSLHDEEGKLLESRIEIDVAGRLVGYEKSGFAFWDGKDAVTVVSGEVRWRR